MFSLVKPYPAFHSVSLSPFQSVIEMVWWIMTLVFVHAIRLATLVCAAFLLQFIQLIPCPGLFLFQPPPLFHWLSIVALIFLALPTVLYAGLEKKEDFNKLLYQWVSFPFTSAASLSSSILHHTFCNCCHYTHAHAHVRAHTHIHTKNRLWY